MRVNSSCATTPHRIILVFAVIFSPTVMLSGWSRLLFAAQQRWVATAWVHRATPARSVRGSLSFANAFSSSQERVHYQPTGSLLFSTTSSPEAEALEQAESLCNDELTQKAKSNLGGIDYYDTSIDNRFRVLFVLGGPGSGKGTQSALMADNFPVAHFSVGELLRNVPDESPHKETIEQSLVAGQIVPVEISLSLLKSAMEKARQTSGRQTLFLVDGFPRNYDNLNGWCRVMKDEAALESVLVYQCPLKVLEQRVLDRAQHSGRSDDNLQSVQKRFRTFETETAPAIDILRTVSTTSSDNRWNVVDIDGDRPLAQVWSSTESVLKRLIIDDVLTANSKLLKAIEERDIDSYRQLCDSAMFKENDATVVFEQHEGLTFDSPSLMNASIEIVTGSQVAVTYTRRLSSNVLMEEKRFWSHKGVDGWRHIHFVRKAADIREDNPGQCSS